MHRYAARALLGVHLEVYLVSVCYEIQTNLSNFTGTAYRNVSRSYVEFQQLYDALTHNNPQTIVPALPLAQTSAPTDEEDDRLVKIMLQRWFTRVCEDMVLVYDEELRSFVESDFGYQPTPRPKRRTSSGFSLIRRHVPDEDEELQRARFELTKLEGQFVDSATALDRVSFVRKGKSSFGYLMVPLFFCSQVYMVSFLFSALCCSCRDGQQAGKCRHHRNASTNRKCSAETRQDLAYPRRSRPGSCDQ
jgi:hypothetical protein